MDSLKQIFDKDTTLTIQLKYGIKDSLLIILFLPLLKTI